jgi:FMN phosphatase YigB (HAD superfamily)
MTIKAIVFDQGGIFIGVDYPKLIQAFKEIGGKNPEDIYTQAEQLDYVDQFERGLIDSKTFRTLLRKNMKGLSDVTDKEIDYAWNAMLLSFDNDILKYIGELKKSGYITCIFSNIDEIHYDGVISACKRDGAEKLFEESFHEKYFSHKFGHNKPSSNSFNRLAMELNKKYGVNPDEILFVDDSHKHIYGRKGFESTEGALSAGWHGLLVKQNLSVDELKESVEIKLSTIHSPSYFNNIVETQDNIRSYK